MTNNHGVQTYLNQYLSYLDVLNLSNITHTIILRMQLDSLK